MFKSKQRMLDNDRVSILFDGVKLIPSENV